MRVVAPNIFLSDKEILVLKNRLHAILDEISLFSSRHTMTFKIKSHTPFLCGIISTSRRGEGITKCRRIMF
jgi:hypothetical protein